MPQTILRPLKLGERIDVSLKLWRASFKKIVAITAPVAVSFAVIMAGLSAYLITVLLDKNLNNFSPTVTSPVIISPNQQNSTAINFKLHGLSFNIFALIAFVALLQYFVSIYAYTATFKVLTDTYVDRNSTISESIKFIFKKIHSVVWIAIEAVVIETPILAASYFATFVSIVFANSLFHDVLLNVTIGFYAGIAIVTFIIFAVLAFSLNIPILFLENEKGFSNIKRAFKIVKKGFFDILGTYFVAYLLVGFFSFILQFATSLILSIGNGFGNYFVMYLVIYTGSLLIATTLFSAVITVTYVDQRVRHEGFDVEMLATGLGYDLGHHVPNQYNPNIPRPNYLRSGQPQNQFFQSPGDYPGSGGTPWPTNYSDYRPNAPGQSGQYSSPQVQNNPYINSPDVTGEISGQGTEHADNPPNSGTDDQNQNPSN